jgi:hypothetical protein
MWRRSHCTDRNLPESGGCHRTPAGSSATDASADTGTCADSGTNAESLAYAGAGADTANGPDLDV